MSDHTEKMLRDWFAFMVPFYIEDVRRSGKDPFEEARRLNDDPAFMERLMLCEDMMFGGKDRRRSKDAYAEVIALLSFAPGGVKTWGLHFEAARGPFFVERVGDLPVKQTQVVL